MAALPLNPTNGQTADGGDGYIYTAYYRPPGGTRYLWVKSGVSANANGIISNAISNAIVTLTSNTLAVGNVSLTANGLATGNTSISENGVSVGNVTLTNNGLSVGNVTLTGNTLAVGNVELTENTLSTGNTTISDTGVTVGNVTLTDNGLSVGNVTVSDNAITVGNVTLTENTLSTGNTTISETGVAVGNTLLTENALTQANVEAGTSTELSSGNITLANTLTGTVTVITGSEIRLSNTFSGQTLVLTSSNVLGTGGGGNVFSVNQQVGNVILTTADIAESGNLYFTNTRVVYALTAGNGVNIDSNGMITVFGVGGGGNVNSVNQLVGDVSLVTANIPESSSNLYYTNTRVLANVLSYLNTSVSSIFINGNGGANGQILVANGDNTINYHTRFYSNPLPPDYAHYGDVWYDTEFAKMYMYVFDEAGEFWFDFLPPDF